MNRFWCNKEILITGGCGSLGKILVKTIMKKCNPKGIRIYSRDEFKHFDFRNELERLINNKKLPRIPVSFLIGNIRDKDRLELAMNNVDIVIHTAALKSIPACEYNPSESMKTNIMGSQNVVDAALKTKPQKVLLISTDKAVSPLNFYGATKMCAEKLFIFGNVYAGTEAPIFSCCRYGNVIGSRGSVIPLFKKQIEEDGYITLTSEDMTRFWISLSQVADFIINRIEDMKGAEIYVPKMPSSYVIDVVRGILKNKGMEESDIEIKTIGLRESEKLNETLINQNEGDYTVEYLQHYIITRDKQPNPYRAVGSPQYSSDLEGNSSGFLYGDKLYEFLLKSGELE